MDEFRIDEDNLSKAKAEMNDHPYQIAISEVKSIIPTWQSTVDQISALLPKVEEEKEEEKIDPLLKDAALFVAKGYAASTSSLQRKFSIGYNRAGAIMSKLEELKIVGPENGRKPREVLVDYNTARRIVEKL
jgi:S-DNA-T family DNA segregation ATPase FtsK/SpoIIIE